jgi:hypothetical protein
VHSRLARVEGRDAEEARQLGDERRVERGGTLAPRFVWTTYAARFPGSRAPPAPRPNRARRGMGASRSSRPCAKDVVAVVATDAPSSSSSSSRGAAT